MWLTVVVPSAAGTSRHAPWPEDALTGSVLRPRLFSTTYAGPISTHYDTIGVRADATAAEIRAAYLARARRQHPDVAGAADEAAAMADLTRAYYVLGHEARRRHYDRTLRGAADPAGTAGEVPDVEAADGEVLVSPGSRTVNRVLTPSGPARMPWKLMAVMAVVGSVAVLASASLVGTRDPEPPDGILQIGSCVAVEPNLDVREVDCAESDLVVRQVRPTGSTCPQPYGAYRDRLGLGTVCVEDPG